MNENTTKLIEQLANSLGTTTKYLWTVLIRQAPIDATITLFQYIILAIVGVILYKVHNRLSKEVDRYSAYDNNDGYGILMVILSGAYLVVVIIAFFCIGDVINGYFNPEYWAVQKILSSLNHR